MRVAILGAAPAGLAEALGPVLASLGFELDTGAGEAPEDTSTQQGEQATDMEAGPAPEDMAKIDGLTDPIIQMRASELTALVNQRDEAVAMAEGERLSHLHCHEGMEEVLHMMRVQGWAYAKFNQQAPKLRWNDLSESIREQLMEEAATEVAAFDEAQSA